MNADPEIPSPEAAPPPPPPPQPPSGPPPPGSGSSGQWAPPGGWTPPPPAGPAPGLAYADFWIRLVAYIVDSIILVIPGILLNGIFVTRTAIVFFDTGQVEVNMTGLVLVALLQVVISWAYFTYTWTHYRASPGQRILGLLVLNEADGSPLTSNQAMTRWLYLAGLGALSSLITGYAVIGAVVGLLVFAWYIYLAYTSHRSSPPGVPRPERSDGRGAGGKPGLTRPAPRRIRGGPRPRPGAGLSTSCPHTSELRGRNRTRAPESRG